ncbi:MAG: radical SAM protein [Anaerovoracaceae bacterium]
MRNIGWDFIIMTSDLILNSKKKCLSGESLTRSEIISLLEIPLGSNDDKLLRKTAKEVSHTLTHSSAYIWSAVGADYAPCTMNCDFCSLGEKWGIIKDSKIFSDDEIIASINSFVTSGARFVVLRTTEFYSIDTLIALVKKIRAEVTGKYEIILNTGEFDIEFAEKMYKNGVDGVYHALRIGEGSDTPFDPNARIATMNSVCQSPLKLISLVEPIGIEHTNEQIADLFQTMLQYKPEISGAMARFPVDGTPLGKLPMLSESRLAQIIAVLRLSGGNIVSDICVHPASKEALESGANVVVVEKGAIPRDNKISDMEWSDFSIDTAKDLLTSCGFTVRSCVE